MRQQKVLQEVVIERTVNREKHLAQEKDKRRRRKEREKIWEMVAV